MYVASKLFGLIFACVAALAFVTAVLPSASSNRASSAQMIVWR